MHKDITHPRYRKMTERGTSKYIGRPRFEVPPIAPTKFDRRDLRMGLWEREWRRIRHWRWFLRIPYFVGFYLYHSLSVKPLPKNGR